jgi:DNA replicative helicase MCM subunit Mcm2 (Cdc46/Mcm family)
MVGIYRAQSVKVQRGRATLKSVFNTYIDLISCKILTDNRFKATLNNQFTIFNDDDKTEFTKMADKDTIINDLIASFAPSIFGQE